MGQAKARGTLEQRIEQAISRDYARWTYVVKIAEKFLAEGTEHRPTSSTVRSLKKILDERGIEAVAKYLVDVGVMEDIVRDYEATHTADGKLISRE